MGIKNIIKFGNNIPCVSQEDVTAMKMAEETSKLDPISSKITIGQEAIIKEGSLKGAIIKICSLPSKERVSVLHYFLGAMRKITIPIKDIRL